MGLLRVLAVLFAFFTVSNAVFTAWNADVTWDEPFHYEWVSRFFRTGVMERLSKQHFDSKTPILIPNLFFARIWGAIQPMLPEYHPELFILRLPSVLYLVGLLLLTFFLARRFWGERAAYLALLALGLDPNLAAHSSLLTVDGMFTFTSLLTLFAAIHFWSKTNWKSGLLLGTALGWAMTAKFSAILLFPFSILLPPLLGIRDTQGERNRSGRIFVGLCMAAFAFWYVIAMSYGFHGIFPSERPYYGWRAGFMRKIDTYAPWLLAPFPFDFLSGIDICTEKDQTWQWGTTMFDRRFPNGVWFYFPVSWLMKTPLPVLLFSMAGMVRGIQKRIFVQDARNRVLFASLIGFLIYFCFIFRAHQGYRYVLMCIPLLYLLVAQGLSDLISRRFFPFVLVGVVFLSATEQWNYFGNPISFLNSLLISKKDAYKYVTDSNVDWKQNDRKARVWVSSRPFALLNPPHLTAGQNVISLNQWDGVEGRAKSTPTLYGRIREEREPDDHLFYSHLLFNVSSREFEEILNTDRKLPENKNCPLTHSKSVQLKKSSGGYSMLHVDGDAVVCVTTKDSADISLRSESNESSLGYWRTYGDFYNEGMEAEQEAWYRVKRSGVLYTQGGPFLLKAQRGEVSIRAGRPIPTDISLPPKNHRLHCEEGVQLVDHDETPVDLYLRGTWDPDWGPWEPRRMTFMDGCYVATFPINRTDKIYEFKIGPRKWSEEIESATIGARNWGRFIWPKRPEILALETTGFPLANAHFLAPDLGEYHFQLLIPLKGTIKLMVTQGKLRIP